MTILTCTTHGMPLEGTVMYMPKDCAEGESTTVAVTLLAWVMLHADAGAGSQTMVDLIRVRGLHQSTCGSIPLRRISHGCCMPNRAAVWGRLELAHGVRA